MKVCIKTPHNALKLFAILVISNTSCKKTSVAQGGNGGGPPAPVIDSVYNPVDTPLSATVGFFLNDWKSKTFTVPAILDGTVAVSPATDSLTIDVNKVLNKVPLHVYGNNANLWMGQIVTQPELMGYLKDLSPNIIRAPAGSVSDIYFWNAAGSAPTDAPPTIFNTDGIEAPSGYWYGGNTASWTLSLSNYYNMLAQTNSKGVITVNYGYARYGTSTDPVATAAHLAADWVRFDNGRTKFWEIGNESYGVWEAGYKIDVTKNKDGQTAIITGALYGKHVKAFADSMRAAAKGIGATIYIGATLYQQEPTSWESNTVKTWNQGVLAQAGNTPDFFIVHNYFTDYQTNSSVSDILGTGVKVTSTMIEYVKREIIAAGVNMKPIALTEWNIQAVGSKQNVSFIAGVHAAKTLGSIIKNNYGLASRWDLANAWSNGEDHGMFNSGDEPSAPLWNPRPAFYYLYYFQKFMGDRMVFDTLRSINNDLTTYSSTFGSGQAGTIIVNSGGTHVLTIDFLHYPAGARYYWYVLTGGTDNGNFSGQVYVNGNGPSSATGGPLNYASLKAYSASLKGTIKITVPALSVIYLIADRK